MKIYIWSVHDKEGTMMHHGEITFQTDQKITDVIQEIQIAFSIDISHYHEFRLKEKTQ
jgi:hypothetical protein